MLRRLLILPAATALLAGYAGVANASLAWTIEPTPSSTANILFGVSCTATASCAAVGEGIVGAGSALAESWDGSAWAIQPTPSVLDANLRGVSCAAATCVAVGSQAVRVSGHVKTLPLAESWNGSSWTLQAIPHPPHTLALTLTAVSCDSAADCTAVGNGQIAHSGCNGVAEHWNGSTWAIQAVLPGQCDLNGISCPAAASCLAAGGAANGSALVADSWNGSTWTPQPPVIPAGAGSSGLQGVSCAAVGNCTAAGWYLPGSGPIESTLAEHWNGSTWTIQPTPDKTGASRSELQAISCAAASSCTATGDYYSATQNMIKVLAEHWNGSTWTVQGIPNPAGPANDVLLGVSCPVPTSCQAVGYQPHGTLAEGWQAPAG